MKYISFILIFLISSHVSYSQKLIRNGSSPKGIEEEVIIDLDKVVSIPDAGDDYYIETNFGSRLGDDGSIFILDKSKILKFDKDGKYVKQIKLPPIGVGFNSFEVIEKYFVVFNKNPFTPSILIVDRLSDERREFKLPTKESQFLYCKDNLVYVQGKQLISLDINTGEISVISNLPLNVTKIAMEGGAYASLTRSSLGEPFLDNKMLISNTEEYEVKILDLETGEIKSRFTRKYERIPNKAIVGGFQAEFIDDLSKIVVRENAIWLVTSVFDEQRGHLVDVFDFKGQYTDRFYLRYSEGGSPVRFQIRDIHNSEILINYRLENQEFLLLKLSW